nr:AlpA family phage regulatory protein [Collimonas arenae]
MNATSLINKKKLLTMIPLADRTIFDMEKRGDFPTRITLNSRNVAWDLAEVEAWIGAKKTSSERARRPFAA